MKQKSLFLVILAFGFLALVGCKDKTTTTTTTTSQSSQTSTTTTSLSTWHTVTITTEQTYTLTFNSNGGSTVSAMTEKANVEITEPSAPIKEGYTFGGWYLNESLSTPFIFNTMPQMNMTLYAKWVIKQVTLTFVTNGGSTVTAITQNYLSALSLPTPTKSNHTFEGWYLDPELTDYVEWHAMPSGNATLYADWGSNGLVYNLIEETYYVGQPKAGTLANVQIPNRHNGILVTGIMDEGFSYNEDLVSIILPKSLKTIGEYAFYRCFILETIELPLGLETIGAAAFMNARSLTSIHIPSSVQTIAGGAFYGAIELTEVLIDEGVVTISEGAFAQCQALVSITLPATLTIISPQLFENDMSLETVVFGDNVTEIGDEAFFNCMSLANITFPESLIRIGQAAFVNARSLTTLQLPSQLQSIGAYAFAMSEALTTATIPASVTEIGLDVFYLCTSLTQINVDVENDYFDSLDGVLYTQDYIQLLIFPAGKSTLGFSFHPNTLTLAEAAFLGNTSLQEIIIPNTITTINSRVFAECPALKAVVISDSVTYLGEQLFGSNQLLTVFVEATSIPMNWNSTWNAENRPVVWGFSMIEQTYHFEENGGSTLSDLSSYYILEKPTIEKEGFYFGGWYNNPTFTGFRVEFPYYSSVATLQTLYARWSVTPIYDGETLETAYPILESTPVDTSTVVLGQLVYYQFIPTQTETYFIFTYGLTSFYKSVYTGSDASSLLMDGSPKAMELTLLEGETYYISVRYTDLYEMGPMTLQIDAVGEMADYQLRLLADGTYALMGYTGDATDIVVPSHYLDSPITTIGSITFFGLPYLETIELPEGILIIEDAAFYGCLSLTKIILPSTILMMDFGILYDCPLATFEIRADVILESWNYEWNHYDNLAYFGETPQAQTYSFGENGGSAVSSVTGLMIEEEPLTVREGFYFYGWYNNAGFEGNRIAFPYYNNDVTKQTLYAKWSDVPFAESSGFQFGLKADGTYELQIYYGMDAHVVVPSHYQGYVVTSIKGGAFYNNGTMISITLPNTIKSIGTSAFEGCYLLESIVIPDSVITIGDSAFLNCDALASIQLSQALIRLGQSVFTYNLMMTSIELPDSLLYLGENAFAYANITSIEIPSQLREIKDYTFAYNSELATVWISENVVSISPKAFKNCNGLLNINVDPNNPYYSSVDGVLFNKSQTELLAYPNGKTQTTYTIPDVVEVIGEYAFASNMTLVNVIFPSTLRHIYDFAFLNCTKITQLFIERVESIGEGAFSGCSSIIMIEIQSNLESIGSEAFMGNSSLSSILLPDSVNSFGNSGAFRNCVSLTTFTIPRNLYTIPANTFEGCILLTEFVTLEGSANFADIDGVLVSQDLQSLIMYPFGRTIDTYTVPEGIREIYPGAFRNNQSLTNVILPEGLLYIHDYAFAYCTSLESLILPSTMLQIYSYAFYYADQLKAVWIPNSVDYIGNNVFEGTPVTLFTNLTETPANWDLLWNVGENPIQYSQALEVHLYGFEENGGTAVDNVTGYFVLEEPIPSKEGFYFHGWFDNPELQGTRVAFPYMSSDFSKRLMFASWGTSPFQDGKTMESAYNLSLDVPNVVAIDKIGKIVYYKLVMPSSINVIVFSSGSFDTYLAIYDSEGIILGGDNDSGPDFNFQLVYPIEGAMIYYVSVEIVNSPYTGEFTFVVSIATGE